MGSFLLESVGTEKEDYFDYDWSVKSEKAIITITYVSNGNTSEITPEMLNKFFMNLEVIKEINLK